jgi:hypothetical protein
MKVTIDCFTIESAEIGGHPENTYDADNPEELARVLHNVTRKIAGIAKVEVYIDEGHDQQAKAAL